MVSVALAATGWSEPPVAGSEVLGGFLLEDLPKYGL
jgi:hypothetical protein